LEPYKPPAKQPIAIPKTGPDVKYNSYSDFVKGPKSRINYKSTNAVPLALKAEPKGITVNPQQTEIEIMYAHLTLTPSSAVDFCLAIFYAKLRS
jgi:hypothetical protein